MEELPKPRSLNRCAASSRMSCRLCGWRFLTTRTAPGAGGGAAGAGLGRVLGGIGCDFQLVARTFQFAGERSEQVPLAGSRAAARCRASRFPGPAHASAPQQFPRLLRPRPDCPGAKQLPGNKG
uniref:Uncharacterized protein n=1 Tax=Tanacetum cinerariifolium TaxID=118510 RepID=A0A699R5J5_TANCI|nr:hypothetical protein [Tanacetum cinerariifolium]